MLTPDSTFETSSFNTTPDKAEQRQFIEQVLEKLKKRGVEPLEVTESSVRFQLSIRDALNNGWELDSLAYTISRTQGDYESVYRELKKIWGTVERENQAERNKAREAALKEEELQRLEAMTPEEKLKAFAAKHSYKKR